MGAVVEILLESLISILRKDSRIVQWIAWLEAQEEKSAPLMYFENVCHLSLFQTQCISQYTIHDVLLHIPFLPALCPPFKT